MEHPSEQPDETGGKLPSEHRDKPKRELPPELKANIWKKGQSGNPSGRPKGRISATAALRKKMAESPELMDHLVDTWFQRAMTEEAAFLKMFLDRHDGAVVKESIVTDGGERRKVVDIGEDDADPNASSEGPTNEA